MSFMNEGQGYSGQIEGISIRIVISIYEDNLLTNNKIIAQTSRNQAIIWPRRSVPFKGQCQIQCKRLEGVVTNVILSKHEAWRQSIK